MNPTLDLIPKAPRRMKQPRKQVLRDQLALAATEIERQRVVIERLCRPWWKRWKSTSPQPKE